ncbi:uncharacterized protein SOCEGT47_048300 [Sorangium cellulosum]|uniref:Uncharacterized protein n=1 Tax=Sorangium cellulosum TaxID=56 RepID=A0A4P2Q5P5_SORCE|nr:hypothetical protein [Sorangium cellulosum]AUX24293.1 uncharacterized protein SOCEGT47_048300 [Sorangium cellulosum]
MVVVVVVAVVVVVNGSVVNVTRKSTLSFPTIRLGQCHLGEHRDRRLQPLARLHELLGGGEAKGFECIDDRKAATIVYQGFGRTFTLTIVSSTTTTTTTFTTTTTLVTAGGAGFGP